MEKFYKEEYLMSFLFVFLIFIENLNAQSFIIPNLRSMSTLKTNSIQYGTLSNLKTFSNIIGRLSTTGRLDIWNLYNINSHILLQSGVGLFENQTSPIIDFSIASDDLNYLGIAFSTTLKIVNLSNLNILGVMTIPSNKYTNISITSDGIYAIDDYKKLFRYSRTDFNNYFTLSLFFIQRFIKLTTCQSVKTGEVALIYSALGRIRSFSCNSAGCTQFNTNVYTITNSAINVTKWELNYPSTDADCEALYYQVDLLDTLKIFNISTGTLTKQFPAIGQRIHSFTPLDSINAYSAAFLQNNSILIYDNDPSKDTDYLVKVIDNVTINPIMRYDVKTNVFWTASDDQIQFYQFRCPYQSYMQIKGLCKSCDQACKTCNYLTGYCYQCKSYSYDLLLGHCFKSGILFQHQLSQFSVQSIQSLSPVLYYLFFFFLLSPVGSSYLLKFLNFWTICSLYILLQIQYPTYLTLILKKIYDQLNESLLQPIGLSLSSISDSISINQKFSSQTVQTYKISSNFLSMNLQGLTILGLSFLILLVPYILKQYIVRKNSWYYNLLNTNYLVISLKKFIGICSSFFFGIQILTVKSYQNNTQQKINTLLYTIFIGLGFISPFLLICSITKKQIQQQFADELNEKSVKNLRNQRKIKNFYTQQLLYEFYMCECNVIFPMLVMIGYKQIFFALNFIFLVFGLYASYRQSKFSVNKLIMSLYLMLFHVCFIGMYIFSIHQYKKVNHYFALFALILIMIGGIHQTFSLFFQVVYQAVKYLKQFKRIFAQTNINNKIQNQINTFEQQQRQKSLQLKKITFKKRVPQQFNNNNQDQKDKTIIENNMNDNINQSIQPNNKTQVPTLQQNINIVTQFININYKNTKKVQPNKPNNETQQKGQNRNIKIKQTLLKRKIIKNQIMSNTTKK